MVYDVIIIGGGASGLSAGIESLKRGYKNTLILEREDFLGGNLNLFIHNRDENITGPEFSSKLVREFKSLGGEYKVNTTAITVSEEKEITYINPKDKVTKVKAEKIIIATGLRERFTGNIIIPIHKYTGILTVAAAHKMINFKGLLPGKEVVIVGRNRWSLNLARRFVIEGAKVKAFLLDSSIDCKIREEDLDIIKDFNIPIIRNCAVTELSGGDRVEEVTILNLDNDVEEYITCDSLVISVGYYRQLEVIRDKAIKLGANQETNVPGIYVCGTARLGEDLLECSHIDGESVYGTSS